VLVVVRGVMRWLGIPVLESMPFSMRWSNGQRIPTLIWRPENPRVPLYELAVLAFVATMIENFIHLNIAAQGTNGYDWGYWVGLFVVILFANGLPLWQVLTSWAAIEYRKTEPDSENEFAKCRHSYWLCSGSPLWAPIEIVTGFSYFLFFGSGFYVGPAAIMLAGITRLRELERPAGPKPPRQAFEITLKRLPPEEAETASLLIDDVSQRPGLYVSA